MYLVEIMGYNTERKGTMTSRIPNYNTKINLFRYDINFKSVVLKHAE